jgi:hypothetical protein
MTVNGNGDPQFYSAKQLARIFNRNVSWIYCAKRRGFQMPGNRATIEALVFWLTENPCPRTGERKRQQMAG